MGIAGTIAKNTTFGMISSVLELGIAFVMSIVLARGLGTELYGLYAYIIWLIGLTAVVINLGLGEMNRRFIPEAIGRQNFHEPVGFVQLSLVLRIAAAIVISIAIVLSAGFWARQSGDPGNQTIFIVVALVTLPEALQILLINTFKGYQRFDYSLYINVAIYPVRMILVIVLIALGFGVMEVLIIYISTLVLGVLVGGFLLRRLLPLKSLFSTSLLTSDARKRALKYSMTIAGVLLLGYLINRQAEVFFIGLYCTVEEVGFYNLGFRISSLVGMLPTAIAFALLPAVAEQFGRGEMDKIKRIYLTATRYLMLVALPLSVGGIALADSIITLLYGVDYLPATVPLQILLIPFAFFGIARAGDAVIRGINHPGFILKTMIVFTVIKIGLMLWLIPAYGISGAAVASSVPRILMLPVYVVFVSRNIGTIWPSRDTIKIVVATLIMGLVVYAVQSQLGVVPSLVVGILLGVVIYVIFIFALRVIQEQDMDILRKAQDSLPVFLRKYYIRVLGFMERFAVRKRLSNGQ